jgi:23S rRNA (cytidine1920-2'-O)/16S rRNA (cytidine1409-2'-O)-methyltransferase
MTAKERLDELLVRRGLAVHQDLAQRLVMAGQVRVAGQVILNPSTFVPAESDLRIIKRPRYVSRGGEKLEAALNAFSIEVNNRICADIGASTGGFTDCLLQHGASKVFAIDVGRGILDWKLRQDPRVVVLEKTNVRKLDELPQPISLATIDVSFISLKVILPVVMRWFAAPIPNTVLQDQADIIALVKPQFEAERAKADQGRGVIRDPQVQRKVLLDVLNFGATLGWQVMGLIASPLRGSKGNREFLVRFRQSGEALLDHAELVSSVLIE